MVCRTIIDRPAFSGNLSVFRAENASRSFLRETLEQSLPG